MGKERWKPVEDYPNYIVSDSGRVQSKARGQWREMTITDDRYGYPKIVLSKDGHRVTKSIHQLVAKAFVDGYSDALQVNHIDGNKHNNNFSNLEWVTVGDNLRHAYASNLNPGHPTKRVRIIETGNIYSSEKECAEATNGSKSGVNGCLRGRRNTHNGFHYEYVD